MADSATPPPEAFVPETGEKPPYQRWYRWVMLALVWFTYFMFGIASFSLAPLVSPIIEDLGISYSQMGIIMGSWPLTYVVLALVGGALTDRWGIRRALFVGMLFIGLSEMLRYFATGFGSMVFFVALFGLGGPMVSIGSPKTIATWFRGKERGLAVGIYTTGVWVGGALAIALMNSVIMPLAGFNWRLAFLWIGLMAFAVAVIWLIFSRDVKTPETAQGPGVQQVFRTLFASRNVQLVLVMGFLTFVMGHGLTGWLPKILEISGLSPAVAGYAASIPVWVGVISVLTFPRLVPPQLRGRLIAMFSVIIMAVVLVIVSATGTPLIISLVVLGGTYCLMPMLVLILMDLPEVGSRHMGAASGMFFCTAELGGFAGPLILGAIKDIAGGFWLGGIFIAVLSLTRLVLALRLKIKPPVE